MRGPYMEVNDSGSEDGAKPRTKSLVLVAAILLVAFIGTALYKSNSATPASKLAIETSTDGTTANCGPQVSTPMSPIGTYEEVSQQIQQAGCPGVRTNYQNIHSNFYWNPIVCEDDGNVITIVWRWRLDNQFQLAFRLEKNQAYELTSGTPASPNSIVNSHTNELIFRATLGSTPHPVPAVLAGFTQLYLTDGILTGIQIQSDALSGQVYKYEFRTPNYASYRLNGNTAPGEWMAFADVANGKTAQMTLRYSNLGAVVNCELLVCDVTNHECTGNVVAQLYYYGQSFTVAAGVPVLDAVNGFGWPNGAVWKCDKAHMQFIY